MAYSLTWNNILILASLIEAPENIAQYKEAEFFQRHAERTLHLAMTCQHPNVAKQLSQFQQDDSGRRDIDQVSEHIERVFEIFVSNIETSITRLELEKYYHHNYVNELRKLTGRLFHLVGLSNEYYTLPLPLALCVLAVANHMLNYPELSENRQMLPLLDLICTNEKALPLAVAGHSDARRIPFDTTDQRNWLNIQDRKTTKALLLSPAREGKYNEVILRIPRFLFKAVFGVLAFYWRGKIYASRGIEDRHWAHEQLHARRETFAQGFNCHLFYALYEAWVAENTDKESYQVEREIFARLQKDIPDLNDRLTQFSKKGNNAVLYGIMIDIVKEFGLEGFLLIMRLHPPLPRTIFSKRAQMPLRIRRALIFTHEAEGIIARLDLLQQKEKLQRSF